MHSNTLQGADHLAKVTGYRIVVPDFFRGQSWPVDNIPPKEGRPFLNAWIQNIGSWEKVRPGLLATLSLVQKDGAKSVGVSAFQESSTSRENLTDATLGIRVLLRSQKVGTGRK